MSFFLSPAGTSEISMDFDSNMSEQDFDYLDSDDNSGSVNDTNEDLLLRDNKAMKSKHNSQNHHDGQDGNMNDGGFSAYIDYSDVRLGREDAEEEEDDEISLHPDDSLFDEEDEFSSSNSRVVRPRLVIMPFLKGLFHDKVHVGL